MAPAARARPFLFRHNIRVEVRNMPPVEFLGHHVWHIASVAVAAGLAEVLLVIVAFVQGNRYVFSVKRTEIEILPRSCLVLIAVHLTQLSLLGRCVGVTAHGSILGALCDRLWRVGWPKPEHWHRDKGPPDSRRSERAARAAVAARRAAGHGLAAEVVVGRGAAGHARGQLSSRAASRRATGEARRHRNRLQSRSAIERTRDCKKNFTRKTGHGTGAHWH